MEAGFQIPGPVWLSAIVIALLLGVSALFSISETALTAASRPRIHALARKGNRRAQLTLKLRERQDVVLAAILLGNNFINIVASALGYRHSAVGRGDNRESRGMEHSVGFDGRGRGEGLSCGRGSA